MFIHTLSIRGASSSFSQAVSNGSDTQAISTNRMLLICFIIAVRIFVLNNRGKIVADRGLQQIGILHDFGRGIDH